MKLNKIHLLAAAAASVLSTAAQAQFVFPTAEIDGGGASLPASAQRQAFDCYGAKTALAFSGAASASNPTTVFDFNFPTTITPTKGNQFNCNDSYVDANPTLNGRAVQPGITARYFSTGSGAGITAWQFHVSPENNPVNPGFANPSPANNGVTLPAGFATFAYGVQFANSDNALSFNNLNGVTGASALGGAGQPIGYNNRILPATVAKDGVTAVPAGTAASRYGAAIQIPVYIAPVALAYSPVYAKEVNGGGVVVNSFRFVVGGARTDGSGGLKLTRAQYCGIMNGVITNYNQLPTTVVNKDVNDANLNWATTGVPIILAGRSESSGTTALFTRAMAAQCTGLSVANGVGGTGTAVAITQKFNNSATTLPAAQVSGQVLTSGAVFNKGTTPTFSGSAEVAGRFTIANGSDGVAQLLAYLPDPVGAGNRATNGRLGYIGPDYTLPATIYTGQNGFGLNTASLAVGTSTTAFVGPTAKDAAAAFTGIQPPQSKLAAGAYCTVGSCNTSGGASLGAGDRANPLDWVFPANKFLVDTATGATQDGTGGANGTVAVPNRLAAPTAGYPIMGTSNVLLYTCYADAATRMAINGVWATFVGKTTKDSTGTVVSTSAIPAKLITDTTKGVLARNGLAAMPAAWQNAIAETFFKSSIQPGDTANATTTRLGARNLWIQSLIPTVAPTTAANTAASNTLCAGLVGA